MCRCFTSLLSLAHTVKLYECELSHSAVQGTRSLTRIHPPLCYPLWFPPPLAPLSLLSAPLSLLPRSSLAPTCPHHYHRIPPHTIVYAQDLFFLETIICRLRNTNTFSLDRRPPPITIPKAPKDGVGFRRLLRYVKVRRRGKTREDKYGILM